MGHRQNIFDGLVCALQIDLDRHRVLDLQEDDGRRTQERTEQETPVAGELGHVRRAGRVPGPHDGRAGGLDALVETDIVGRVTAGVAERTHEPVRRANRISIRVLIKDTEHEGAYQ